MSEELKEHQISYDEAINYLFDKMPDTEYEAAVFSMAIAAINLVKQPNSPLTLDELRKMNGEPVWVEDLEKPVDSEWKICYWDRGKYLVLTSMHC
jgi:hypothetical protein